MTPAAGRRPPCWRSTAWRRSTRARANLQTILDNLTAGVIVLDAQRRRRSRSNPGATAHPASCRLARLQRPAPVRHCRLGELWPICVQRQFEDFAGTRATSVSRPLAAILRARPASVAPMHGAHLTAPSPWWRGVQSCRPTTRLLVFDDISDIVSAQRAQAWSEVAGGWRTKSRTRSRPSSFRPSAWRSSSVESWRAESRPCSTKSVKTIVDQVEAMKRLVNEFRDYAAPAQLPSSKPLDLNALVQRRAAPLRPAESTKCPIVLELDARPARRCAVMRTSCAR